MEQIGIRALKQNASAVVARAAAGEALVITDNGRPVAQIMPLPTDRLDALDQAGLLRTATATASEIGPPTPRDGGRTLGDALREMRDEDDR
jgi:prevent-host-death family protein